MTLNKQKNIDFFKNFFHSFYLSHLLDDDDTSSHDRSVLKATMNPNDYIPKQHGFSRESFVFFRCLHHLK